MQLPKLNEQEKVQLRLEIEKEIYTRSLYEFFVAASKVLYPQVEWDYPPFYKYICDLLQAEVERIINKEEKTKDYIFNLPFRAGKSILLSQIFPVWCWIKEPSLAIMQVSHSETLAIKHSHASKMLIESEWFLKRFPALSLRVDTHAKANYMNQSGGKRISFGINSGIIGEGANIQIIDDINNPQDSQTVTQGINEVYTDTLYSRLNNPAIDLRIILQQRISQIDICQYLLDTNPQKYFHVCLPVKVANNINPPEAIEFYKNGLLWKERFSEKVILDFQSTLGSRAFAGQLMQKPVSEQGNIIKRKWIKSITLDEWDKLTEKQEVIWNLYVDTAYTKKSNENDASAAVLACEFQNNVYVKKAWKWWLEFPELIKELKTVKQQYNVRMIYIESKASGLSVKQQLQRDGFDVADLTPKDKDKITRANAIAPKVEGGHLWFIFDTWNEMVMQEITSFPFGHDDIMDCVVYSIDNLLNKSTFNYGMT